MSTTTKIYSAYDMPTDTLVSLEHRFTPWGSWHTTVTSDHRSESMHDDLTDAAQRIANALQNFKDADPARALGMIAATINRMNGDEYLQVEDFGEGPQIIDYCELGSEDE